MRRRLLLPLLLAALLAGADTTDLSRPLKIHLADGSYVIGKVVDTECTDESLVVRDMRSHAKRTLPWSDVKEDQARDLRVALGFEVAEASGGMKVEGVRIVNRAGHEFVGVLVNAKTAERDGYFDLKTADGPRRIPIEDVNEGPEAVQLDAAAVYTPLELYDMKVKAKKPETAKDHFQLAEFCRLYGALEQAKTHYEKVIGFGDSQYPEAMIQRQLARVIRRLESKEAEDALKEIKQKIIFKRFPEARELIAKFREAYASDEDYLNEASEQEQKLEEERTKYFTAQVPGKLRDAVKDLLNKKVREPDLSLRTAQQYAGGDPGADKSVSFHAVLQVSERFGIEPKEVLTFWEGRSKHAIQKGFYRDGTFIVVENLEDALSRAPKVKAGKAGDKGPKPPKPSPRLKPDEWWERKVKARKFTELRDWLYAWWAENSGMVEVLPPKESTCQTCSGNGYTQQMHQSSQGAIPFFNRCQTCYEATYFRIVQFK